MKNIDHYGCLTKKNCPLKLYTMVRNTFNIRGGRCKFPLQIVSTINWFFLRNCLMLTSVSQFFSSLRDSEFRYGFLIF